MVHAVIKGNANFFKKTCPILVALPARAIDGFALRLLRVATLTIQMRGRPEKNWQKNPIVKAGWAHIITAELTRLKGE